MQLRESVIFVVDLVYCLVVAMVILSIRQFQDPATIARIGLTHFSTLTDGGLACLQRAAFKVVIEMC